MAFDPAVTPLDGLGRDELVGVIEELVVERTELAASVAALVAERDELVRRLTALEARVAARAAGGSSGTSGTPPSADVPKRRAERRREAREKQKARQQEKGRRNPGKQSGAAGSTLPAVSNPDDTDVHEPDRCCGCGAGLDDAVVVGVEKRQVFEIPTVEVHVTEHQAVKKRCGCGTVTVGVFPGEAKGARCYGPRLRALAVYLMITQHVPYERCAEALRAICGADVSVGSIDNWVAEASKSLDPFVVAVKAALIGSDVVHFDETSTQVGLDQWWLHIACNDLYTWIHADESRGTSAVTAAGILDHFTGVAVHDRLAMYFGYLHATHAACGAHLLRDLAAVGIPEAYKPWTEAMTRLLLDAKTAADRASDRGRDKVPASTRRRYLNRYDTIVDDAFTVIPDDPKARAGNDWDRKAFNLATAFRRLKAEIMRFLTDLNVPLTNNAAERGLRPAKNHDKISGHFRSPEGATRHTRLRSYLATLAKHGNPIHPLQALEQLFTGNPWIPPPTPTH